MADEPKDRLAPEEVARLSVQTHGVIDGAPASLPLRPEGKRSSTGDEPATLSREGTPPPLPPSPAASAAEVWLEEAVTRPSAFADLASQVGHSPSAPAPTEGASAESDPLALMREAHEQALRSLRLLLVLSSATAFVLGLVLGAILFKG